MPNQRMKILYTNSMYSPDIGGGAEIMLKAMVDGMKARGHDVQVLTTHNKSIDSIDRVDGIEVHRLKLRNLYWPHSPKSAPNTFIKAAWHALDTYNPLMARAIRKKLKEIQPDILVSNNLPGFGINLWREAHALNIPVVQVLHDYYLICPKSTMFKDGGNCGEQCRSCSALRQPHAEASNLVSTVIGVSNAILQIHLQNNLFGKTKHKNVIYNARHLPPAELGPSNQNAAGGVSFGFIGALTEVKGIESLINAFKCLNATDTRHRLLIAGTGKEKFQEHLKKLTNSTKNIEFLGHAKPEEFFSKIDVCVIPSKWNDPLPGVTYEALNYKKPVIGSQLGGIPEVIDNPANGILFDPNDPPALLLALQRFINTQNTFKPDVSRKFCDTHAMLSQYEDALNRTIAAGT